MSIEKILKQIVEIAVKHGAEEVWLYGSYANGTNRRCSDIDIAVDKCNNLHDLMFDFNENIHTLKTINPVVLPRQEDEPNQLFRREILDGKKIHG